MLRVLHLSDLHIGNTYLDSKQIAYKLIADIVSNNNNKIDCIIFTGDIFEGNKGDSDEIIQEAVNFFNILYEHFNNKYNISKEDFMFVPGNHDVIRNTNGKNMWDKYNSFLKKFYINIPKYYDMNNHTFIREYKDQKIVFFGLNTCEYKFENTFTHEYISSISQIIDENSKKLKVKKGIIKKILEKNNKQFEYHYGDLSNDKLLKFTIAAKDYSDYNIIVCMHHHFYLFPDVYMESSDSSLIKNYSFTVHSFQEANVRTVLHGHKHYDYETPLVTDKYFKNPNEKINVIAAGSIGSMRTTKHSYNLIDFYGVENDYKVKQIKIAYNGNSHLDNVIRTFPPEIDSISKLIKLEDFLKHNNEDLFKKYEQFNFELTVLNNDYYKIVDIFEKIISSFPNALNIIKSNPQICLYILYSIKVRIYSIQKNIKQENNSNDKEEIINKFLDKCSCNLTDVKEDFLKLLNELNINRIKNICDSIFSNIKKANESQYICFSLFSIFLTDVYMFLSKYSNWFYDKYLSHKTNISLKKSFNTDTFSESIKIFANEDRRSLSIEFICNSAESHKLSVLFVKEFEIMINKLENYLKKIELKIYHITPIIKKTTADSSIEDYNFEAYIPTLIPLLTGDNIYSKKEVFSRELIQNSIDAIAVRENYENDFDKTIIIKIYNDDGKRYFSIKDSGIGMDKYKIERYFTSIGRSFYSSSDYDNINSNYKPISSFGIGFLSVFMVAKNVEVKTKSLLEDNAGIMLHIPNYDGCFFLESNPHINVGTEIILCIDDETSNYIKNDNIINYITDIMINQKYPIMINNCIENKTIWLKEYALQNSIIKNASIFVSFLDDFNIGKFSFYEYIENENLNLNGLLINLESAPKHKNLVLNSGIKLSETSAKNIWEKLFEVKTSNSFSDMLIFNFPSNYIEIDVSREKLVNFTKKIKSEEFLNCLIDNIFIQSKQLIRYSKEKENKCLSIKIQNLFLNLLNASEQNSLNKKTRDRIAEQLYDLYIKFNDEKMEIILEPVIRCKEMKESGYYPLNKSNYEIIYKCYQQFIRRNSIREQFNSYDREFFSTPLKLWYRRHNNYRVVENKYEKIINLIDSNDAYSNESIKLLVNRQYDNNDNKTFSKMLMLLFCDKNNSLDYFFIFDIMLIFLLNKFTINEVENFDSKIILEKNEIKECYRQLENSYTREIKNLYVKKTFKF